MGSDKGNGDGTLLKFLEIAYLRRLPVLKLYINVD
jgi:hypothetical protein